MSFKLFDPISESEYRELITTFYEFGYTWRDESSMRLDGWDAINTTGYGLILYGDSIMYYNRLLVDKPEFEQVKTSDFLQAPTKYIDDVRECRIYKFDKYGNKCWWAHPVLALHLYDEFWSRSIVHANTYRVFQAEKLLPDLEFARIEIKKEEHASWI